MGERLGYVRISSSDQGTARQWEDVQLDQKFVDTISEKDTSRPELMNLLRFARKAVTALVHSLTLITRNTSDFLGLPVMVYYPWLTPPES